MEKLHTHAFKHRKNGFRTAGKAGETLKNFDNSLWSFFHGFRMTQHGSPAFRNAFAYTSLPTSPGKWDENDGRRT